MHRPQRRRPAQWPATRWGLIGLIIAGVLAMHVLDAHDSAGAEVTSATHWASVTATAAGQVGIQAHQGAGWHADALTTKAAPGCTMKPGAACCLLFPGTRGRLTLPAEPGTV